MHNIKELHAWERLFKRMVWAQIGEIKGKTILDFGSGEGVTANYFAKENTVVAIEPSLEMLKESWNDFEYKQIIGDLSALKDYPNDSFDFIICHNVLEYIDDKEEVIHELCRVLKQGGVLSIVKHHRAGRVMQMAVLLDDFDKANDLLDGKNGLAARFGTIQYYEDDMISRWEPCLHLVDSFGMRTFFDLQQNQEKHKDDDWQEEMFQLEMKVSQRDEYRNIAFFHHLLFRKQSYHK